MPFLVVLSHTIQKLQHLQVASEEERKRLEAAYKEKLAAADDKLKALRHKEREFVSMQKLKQRTEVSRATGMGVGLIQRWRKAKRTG